MVFYNPISTTNRNTLLLVYPEVGIEQVVDNTGKLILDRARTGSVEQYYEKTIGTGQGVGLGGCRTQNWKDSRYLVSFLWHNSGNLFFDLWEMRFGWDSGPLAFPYLFGGPGTSMEVAQANNHKLGAASGNTFIVLGREEEQRRILETRVKLKHPDLSENQLRELTMTEYSKRSARPELPFKLSNGEEFYL